MTRTTDDLNPERFQPLGAPIRKESAPMPVQQRPQGKSGIVTDPDGRIRTTSHKPAAYGLSEAIQEWAKAYNAERAPDFE